MLKVSRAVVGAEELEAMREVFDLRWFGIGSKVFEFEQKVQEFLGTDRTVIAVNSGTAALHLALVGLGIGPGDEVIVPSLTFVASFQAVTATGARGVACDVDPDTLLLSIDDAERRITPATRAIMPVHYCGNPCDLDRLLEIGRRRGLAIVEDAAHAFGSFYKGRPVGRFGDITCFSFDTIKNITCGEGGAVICREGELAERMRQMRVLGVDRDTPLRYRNQRAWVYEVHLQGFRYHMSNLNAAIGLAQMKKATGFIARRREIARRYDAAFRQVPELRILPIDYSAVAPHIYILRVPAERRNNFMDFMQSRDIETGIHYLPNHKHPYFATGQDELPGVDRVAREIVTIPLHCEMTDSDVERVIESVQAFFITTSKEKVATR